MGYRSEVGVLITVPDKVNSSKLVEKIAGIYGNCFYSDFDVVKEFKKDENRYIYFHCDWVKWYESFKDVKAFMKFISSWEKHYKTGGVDFVRIGESYEDLEENVYGDPQEYIRVERYMAGDYDD